MAEYPTTKTLDDPDSRRHKYPPLSPRQKVCLNLILRLRQRTQLVPTYVELAAKMGVGVPTVMEHLRRLEKKGRIVKQKGSRAIVVLRDH